MGRVFANEPGDLGSIPGRVIPKTLKMVLDTSLLNTQIYNIRYVSRVKWSNPGKGVAPSPTHRCSSYWNGSLLVALDHGRQLYFIILMMNTVIPAHIENYSMPIDAVNNLISAEYNSPSSSSCADSKDLSDFLPPTVPIIHCSRKVYQKTSTLSWCK